MSALFITGAGTEVGKTYVTCALLRALRAEGRACDALKPIVSGYDEAAPDGSDPALLLEAVDAPVTRETLARMSPFRYRAPLAADMAARAEGRSVDYEAVLTLCRARAAETDGLLLIEGAGGLFAPVDETRSFADLIIALGAPAIIVGGSYLGAIHHALATLHAARAYGVTLTALIISESAPPAPSFSETLAAIRARAGETPVLGVPRGASLPEGAPLPL